MTTKVIMPKQGLQMTEGTIINWLVKENGQAIKGEPLFDMETDKLTITIDAPASGTLLKIVRGEGDTVPITETIAIIGDVGEDYSALLENSPFPVEADTSGSSGSSGSSDKKENLEIESPFKDSSVQTDDRVFVTPRARMLAQTENINFEKIKGSGPEGLIIERDILAQAGKKPKATPLARKLAALSAIEICEIEGTGTRGKITRADVLSEVCRRNDTGKESAGQQETCIPFSPMRRTIAKRMTESLQTAAQATHRVRADMTEAARLRETFKAEGKRISYNDIAALAVCRALTEFPIMNSEIREDAIILKHYVNLGIAVALEDGLIVPVISNAHLMELEEISAATRQLADKAKNRQLKPKDYTCGSFTISNLGMYGLDSFVAVLNPPESGILAIGRIADTPVVNVERVIEVRLTTELTLTYDHRVVDGAPAAQFLMRVKQYLEQPYLLL